MTKLARKRSTLVTGSPPPVSMGTERQKWRVCAGGASDRGSGRGAGGSTHVQIKELAL